MQTTRKKVLFIAGNYYPELTGIGRYNSEMINWLADYGFICTVFTTYPYYPYWKIQEPYTRKSKWYKTEKLLTAKGNAITVIRCPHYVPGQPSGKKRMLLDFTFFLSVNIRMLAKAGKQFDYVINVSPPLPLGVTAVVCKKMFKSKFLYHIQDLQVDAARNLEMISSNKLINFLLKIEQYILRNADCISTISEGMVKKVQTKIKKDIFLLPNWSDTKIFFPKSSKQQLKEAFGFDPQIPLVLYSGAIGVKQGLSAVLKAADFFSKQNRKIQFVICGSGPYKEVLQENAAVMQLNNLVFLPLQPNEKLNDFLNMADIHLVIQKAKAADLLMPSKLATILSIGGLALVTANENSGLYNLVNKYKMGVVIPTEDLQSLISCIDKMLDTQYDEIRQNARSYAEKYLSIDTVMHKYVKEIMNIQSPLDQGLGASI